MATTALITGASTGIGKELAILHARQKGDLILVARSGDKLRALQSQLEQDHGVQVLVLVQDLTHPDAPQAIFDAVQEQGLQVDYLINNAGFGGVGKFHERNWEDDHNMILLNVVALTALTRLFLPAMVQRRSGKILNVSSTASLLPGPMQAVYYATKAYVSSFSNAIAEEVREANVTVTNLMPGATETEFGRVSGMNKTELFSSAATAQSVAQAGYDGLLAGKLDVLAGLNFQQSITMKMVPFLPKKMLLKQIHQLQQPK